MYDVRVVADQRRTAAVACNNQISDSLPGWGTRALLLLGVTLLGSTSACGSTEAGDPPAAQSTSSAASPGPGKCSDTQNVSGSQGELAVRTTDESIDEAVSFIKRYNVGSTVVATEPLTIPGFNEARAVYFRDSKSANYTVVGVTGSIRAVAYTIVQSSADSATPTAAACMRTLEVSTR